MAPNSLSRTIHSRSSKTTTTPTISSKSQSTSVPSTSTPLSRSSSLTSVESEPPAKRFRTSFPANNTLSLQHDASPKRPAERVLSRHRIIDENTAEDGKIFLASGLYYEEGITPIPSKSPANSKKSSYPTVVDDDWKSPTFVSWFNTFPLPKHHAVTLLEEDREFKLSFDILRDFYTPKKEVCVKERVIREKRVKVIKEPKEIKEKIPKPPPYRYTARNIYFERKADKAEIEAICQCKLPDSQEGEEIMVGCGEECINRMMQYSCSAKTCAAGSRCSNLPLFQQVKIPEGKDGLTPFWTGDRGFGLKTMVDIKKGALVIEYTGEVIPIDESYRRVLKEYADSTSYYFLQYDAYDVIDAGQRGNSARFINHSCGPNLEVVRWKLSDFEEYQMGIFALYDIPAGTELTYDYGWQDFSTLRETTSKINSNLIPPPESGEFKSKSKMVDLSLLPTMPIPLAAGLNSDTSRQKCFCGALVCSGWLGGKREKEDKQKKKKNQEEEVVVVSLSTKESTEKLGSKKGSLVDSSKRKKKKVEPRLETVKSSIPLIPKKRKRPVGSSMLLKGKKDKVAVAVVKKMGVVIRAAPRVRG